MDKPTIDTYDQIAKDYELETETFWDEFPVNFLNEFIEKINGPVLDIGSGPGRDGLILKEKGLEVTCLDASPVMIELSKAKGLKSVLGDFMNLPFPRKSFSGIWAYTSLLHIPKKDFKKALEEIKRVLEDGGVLGLGLIEGEEEFYKYSAGEDKPRWFSYFTEEEIINMLKDLGFKKIYFEKFKPGKRNYLNFIFQKT